jgi:hypothetical protein
MTELAKTEVGRLKLLAMGYEYDYATKHIVSIFNGRKFSYTDTEHIACKLYLCIAYAHPSRTISDEPFTHSDQNWPVPGDDESRSWMPRVEQLFKRIRQATTKLGSSADDPYFKNHYSKYLEYNDDEFIGPLGEGFRQIVYVNPGDEDGDKVDTDPKDEDDKDNEDNSSE